MATRHPPADHAQRATDDRSQRATVAYLAFLGIVMAVGVDIALPAFARISDTFSLSDGDGQVSLVGTTYFLGMATGQLVFGPASDRFGRRRCLQIGIVLAAIGALGAAIAPSFTLLLVDASPGVSTFNYTLTVEGGEEVHLAGAPQVGAALVHRC